GQRSNILTADGEGAVRYVVQTLNELGNGGFTASRGADDGGGSATLDLEIQSVQGGFLRISKTEVHMVKGTNDVRIIVCSSIAFFDFWFTIKNLSDSLCTDGSVRQEHHHHNRHHHIKEN